MPLEDYDSIIRNAADEWNLDPAFLKAVIAHESNGDPNARSSAGAIGLGQLMPDTAMRLGVTNRYDPAQSVYGAAKYLDLALNTEGDPARALLYYHGGPGWRGNYGPESANYVPAVAKRYAQFASADTKTATDATSGDSGPSFEDVNKKAGAAPASTAPAAPASPTAPAAPSFEDVSGKAGPAPSPAAAPPQREARLPGEGPVTPPELAAELGLPQSLTEAPAHPPSAPPNPLVGPGSSLLAGPGGYSGQPGTPTVPGEMPSPTPPSTALDRIWQAAVGAAKGTEPTLTPYGSSIAGPVLNALATGVIDPARTLANALSGGVLQTGYEAGEAIAPGLGRDIATGLMVAPAAGLGAEYGPWTAATRGAMREGTSLRPGEGFAVPPSFTGNLNPLDPSIVDYTARRGIDAPSTEVPPEPVPAPQPAGAQITPPAAVPERTPVEINRDLQTDIRQTAEDRAGPGMQDHNIYVPGVQRTLAGRVFSPANSLDEKLSMTDTAFRDKVERIDKNNDDTMKELLYTDAGDKLTLKQLYDAREELTPDEIKLFANERPVDAQPLVTAIDNLLASPAGKRGAVTRVLNDIRSKLFDADGNLETMPSQLYGARQNMTDLLKKGATGTGDIASDAKLSKKIIEDLLPQTDSIINDGAPRYQQYLDDFHEASKPINQQEYLQDLKLTGAGGRLQLSRVQSALDRILKDRSGAGVNKAKSLTGDEIQNLVNVRNELAATDLKNRLAATRGSDTVQQLQRAAETQSGPVGQAVAHAADMAAEATAAGTLGPFGPTVYRLGVKPAIQAFTRGRAQARAQNALRVRKDELLQTEPNALQPPP